MAVLERLEAEMTRAGSFELDLGDEEFRQNARDVYAPRWATQAPFYARRQGMPVVLCTQAKDFREVMGDPARFAMKVPDIPGYEAFDIFGGLESVLQMDGERHNRVRRLMTPAFAPAQLLKLRPAVEQIVERRLDHIEASGTSFDAMPDFCDHLIVGSLLEATFNLEPSQRAAFERVHRAIFALNFHPGKVRPQEYLDAIAGVRLVLAEIIEDRRREPRDDFISRLIIACDHDDRLHDAELEGQINTVCGAALGSTATSLAAALFLLGQRPETFDRVKQDDALVDGALEECVRMHCPGMFVFPRFATEDTEVNGTFIPAASVVMASPQAANFDPVEFADPLRLDVTRQARNMSFGMGVHHCIGVLLARTTMRIGMRALIRRFPNIRLADPDFRPTYGGNVGTLTIKSLPMRWD